LAHSIQFVTDFADEAVVLPVAGAVLAVLLATGWRRGAAAWVGSIAVVLGLMVVLKAVVFACGHLIPWSGLASPSGHTAASAAIYGGLLALLAPQSRRGALVAILASSAIALLFASTRLALGVHTVPDVLAGATVGISGALLMRLLAGPRPRIVPRPWLLVAAALAMVVFHGTRLQAEQRIRGAALGVWPLSACRG